MSGPPTAATPPRPRGRGRLIVRGALAIGVVIILGGGTARRLRHLRMERACETGDLDACIERCSHRRRSACEELTRRCTAGEAEACAARDFVQTLRRRLPF